MQIRVATPADNETLQAAQGRCPQGVSLIVSTVNAPDFFARAKAYAEYRVFVAEIDGRLAGSMAVGLRDGVIGGRTTRVAYLFQAFVLPEFRRQDVGSTLLAHCEAYGQEQGAVLAYGLVIEGNAPSMAMLERAGWVNSAKLLNQVLLLYKPMTVEGRVRSARREDLPALTTLINAARARHDLRDPFTPESLAAQIARLEGFSLENLLVLEADDVPIACAGYWDWSRITRVTVQQMPLRLKLIRLALSLAGRFTRLPTLPGQGDTLRQWCVVLHGARDAAHLSPLLAEINNRALAARIDQLFVLGEAGDPLLTAAKRWIGVDSAGFVFLKRFDPALRLGSRLMLDGIDL